MLTEAGTKAGVRTVSFPEQTADVLRRARQLEERLKLGQ